MMNLHSDKPYRYFQVIREDGAEATLQAHVSSLFQHKNSHSASYN